MKKKKLFLIVDMAKWFSITSSSFSIIKKSQRKGKNLLKKKLFLCFCCHVLLVLWCLLAIVKVFSIQLHKEDAEWMRVAKSHKMKINTAENVVEWKKFLERDKNIFVENYIKHENRKSVSEDSPSMPSVAWSAGDNFRNRLSNKETTTIATRKPYWSLMFYCPHLNFRRRFNGNFYRLLVV